MTQPILPPELHKLIIDIIGDKDIGDMLEHPRFRLKNGALDTLRACSLVCKDWHSLTLRQTFRSARLDLRGGERAVKRCAELYQLLEVNALIGQCIRRVEVQLELSSSREAVERVCHVLSSIETLRVVLHYHPFEFPRPSPLDGLHPVLTTQHLRNLTILSNRLPLHLLEDLTNLRSLTLQGVQVLDIEHNHDRAWRSSTLAKLVLTDPVSVLNQIWALTLEHRNVGLAAFFDRLKYLDMHLTTSIVPRDTGSWASLLARWKHLGTLVVRWTIVGQFVLGEFVSIRFFGSAPNTNRPHLLKADITNMLELSQIIPWKSFQALRVLTYDITYFIRSPRQPSNRKVDASTLIFTGPSRLPNLQDLHVTYSNDSILCSQEDLDMSLNPTFLYDLNRTIEDPSSFPSLQTFHTEVVCTVKGGASSQVLDGQKLVQQVADWLPAVFGIGGRKEMCGWTTITTVRIVPWGQTP